MPASVLVACLCTVSIALNTIFTPTDNMFGVRNSRTWHAATKGNPVACAANVLYSVAELRRSVRENKQPELGSKAFLSHRVASWDHRDSQFVKFLSDNYTFRTFLAIVAAGTAAIVFLSADCNTLVRVACLSYLAQFIFDFLVTVYAAKLKIAPHPPEIEAQARQSRIPQDLICHLSLLSLILVRLNGSFTQSKPPFIALTLISTVVVGTGHSGIPGSVFLVVCTTLSGVSLGIDLMFAATVGINLGITSFLLQVFGVHAHTRCGPWVYLTGTVLTLLTALLAPSPGPEVSSAGLDITDLPGSVNSQAWWPFFRDLASLLFPGTGPVANTMLCLAFMYLIARMMTRMDMFVPKDS